MKPVDTNISTSPSNGIHSRTVQNISSKILAFLIQNGSDPMQKVLSIGLRSVHFPVLFDSIIYSQIELLYNANTSIDLTAIYEKIKPDNEKIRDHLKDVKYKNAYDEAVKKLKNMIIDYAALDIEPSFSITRASAFLIDEFTKKQDYNFLTRVTSDLDNGADPWDVRDQLKTYISSTTPRALSDSKIFIPTWENQPADREPLINLNGYQILSVGNISLLTSLPGIGKSSICEAIASSAINDNADTFGFEVECSSVLYVDTERSDAMHWRSWRRMMKRAGVVHPDLPENVTFVNLVSVPGSLDKRNTMQQLIHSGGYDLIIIDGAGDFVTDVNSSEESAEFSNWIRALANERNIGFFLTIHTNPQINNLKGRGHLGSELQRRAESVFTLHRDTDTGQRTLTSDFSYGKNREDDDRLDIYFEWDDSAGMFVSCSNKIPKRRPGGREDLEKLAGEVFPDNAKLTYGEAIEKIMTCSDVKESMAKRKLKKMIKLELVCKDEYSGVYSLI